MKPLRLGRIAPVLTVVALVLSGCGAQQTSQGVNDPLEGVNRKVHGFNKGVDRALARPAATAYGKVVPDVLRVSVSNMADNAAGPGLVANGILQGDIEGVATNTFRFVLNTTVGVLGLFDPAKAIGLEEKSTDFGETLHVWGVGEGAYVELPFFGPSTSRDAVGIVVDYALDPLGSVLNSDQKKVAAGLRVARLIDRRYRFGDTIDSVLYDSADSYAQARITYLQNRRFELGGGDGVGDLGDDPYLDPYADPYADPQ